jgi:hypothetical protein
MRGRGITYDTGFVRHGAISRERFEPDVVRRELGIIRDDLHCTAVRITGGDPARLALAATYAADLGLEVWLSPYPLELDTAAMLSLFADCAERAEQIRRRGADVVLVTGAELSLMDRGLLPGDTQEERLARLLDADPDQRREQIGALSARVNTFLGEAAGCVRARFGGKISYASIPLEGVDWNPFDFVGVDLYRSAEVADRFAEGVRTLVAQGKPVAITEFGTAAYRGAGDRGGRVMEIVEFDRDTGVPIRLNGVYVRDEAGQAAYIRELLEVFDAAGVDSAFVFLFALDGFPHRPEGDPRNDMDLASPGIVSMLEDRTGDTYPGLPWEPKAAFWALAESYGGR